MKNIYFVGLLIHFILNIKYISHLSYSVFIHNLNLFLTFKDEIASFLILLKQDWFHAILSYFS